MPHSVTYELQDGVAHITMDDGKVNVMSIDLLDALDAAFSRAEAEASIVVLRSGRPGIFSAGFDLKVFAAADAERSVTMVRAGAELALRLMGFPIPVVGIVEGHAFPMGTFLLLASDVRIAARGPWTMGLNEVAIRITPPGFAVELARSRLHPAWLSRTVVLGEMFEPDEALTAGFLDHVADANDLDAVVTAALERLLTLDPAAHGSAKRRLRAPAMAAMRHAIDSELTLAAYRQRGDAGVRLPGTA